MKQTTKDRLIPVALIFLSLIPAIAGSARLAELSAGAAITPANARFFNSPLPVLLHIPAALLYSLVGAFQFSPGIRKRYRRWHRMSGIALIPMSLLVAVTGLWMAHFYAWPAGDGVMVYVERLMVGVAMLAFIGLGVRALVRRKYNEHGEWMIRAYAIALGAGTQVITHLPWFIFVDGKPGEFPRGVMMGGAWVINVVAAEWIIRRGRARLVSVRVRERGEPAGGVEAERVHQVRRGALQAGGVGVGGS